MSLPAGLLPRARWSTKRRGLHSNASTRGSVVSGSGNCSNLENAVAQLSLRGSTPRGGRPRWSTKRRSLHSTATGVTAASSPQPQSTVRTCALLLQEDNIVGFKDSDEKELTEKEKEAIAKLFDEHYFGSYEKVAIHFRMIRDKIRTETYRDTIEAHKKYLEGKTVMDVGCGTGILSLFAVVNGAKEVYAIERSGIAEYTQKIVNKNRWYHRIRVLHGSVEEFDLPSLHKSVDVIISEWMGYCLIYESMLDSVLYARDKWLAPNGLMFPEKCRLYIFGMEDLAFYDWKYDLYSHKLGNVDVSCLKNFSLGYPVIKRVDHAQMVTNAVPLIEFDLYTMKKEDVNFEVDFTITAKRQDYISALATYFIVKFPPTPKKTWLISTHPGLPLTHWMQTCFYLNGYIPIFEGEKITGTFKAQQNARNKRRIDFVLKIDYEGQGGSFHQQNEYSLM